MYNFHELTKVVSISLCELNIKLICDSAGKKKFPPITEYVYECSIYTMKAKHLINPLKAIKLKKT